MDTRFLRDYYTMKVITTPMQPPLKVYAAPFTDSDLKKFDKVLGHKRSAQKNKMRQVFQSCGFTESKFLKSGRKIAPTTNPNPIKAEEDL